MFGFTASSDYVTQHNTQRAIFYQLHVLMFNVVITCDKTSCSVIVVVGSFEGENFTQIINLTIFVPLKMLIGESNILLFCSCEVLICNHFS